MVNVKEDYTTSSSFIRFVRGFAAWEFPDSRKAPFFALPGITKHTADASERRPKARTLKAIAVCFVTGKNPLSYTLSIVWRPRQCGCRSRRFGYRIGSKHTCRRP